MISWPLRQRSRGGERPRAGNQFIAEAGARDEPPIGAEIHNPGIRWDLMMVVFLRLMATVWLIRSIGYWAVILGFGDLPLIEESRLRQGIIVAFALLDCVAAVGIWLLAPWGKSLWVFVLAAEIVLGLTGFGRTVGYAGAVAAMMALFFFFVLAFAARSRYLGKL
jgi:hypothetical protein